MLQCLFGVVPLNLADVAQVDDEVLCQWSHVRWKRPLCWFDKGHLLLQRLRVVRHNASTNKQRVEPNQHAVHSDPCSVDIDLLAILLTRDLFWRHVESSSDSVFMRILDAHPLLGREPKINDLKVVFLVHLVRRQLDIFRLDVPVNVI